MVELLNNYGVSMKKNKLWALAAVMLFLVGCIDEQPLQPNRYDESLELKLRNEIVQVPTTRVNDEGFCDGDGVGVYVVNYADGKPGSLQVSGNQADNVKFVYHESDDSWVPSEPVYFKDKHTAVDIFGYYPYSSPTSVSAYPFEVQKDQSTEAMDGKLGGYEASDFLWGKAENIAPTSSRVNIQFMHRMAGVMVTLTEGTGFDPGEFAMVDKAALVTNTVRKATIDLSTGVVVPTGDAPATGIVPYYKDGNFRAVVVPQTVAASTPLFSLTVDGIPYVFRKSEAFEYVAGKLHKFTIEVSKKSQSGLEFKLLGESITAWETDNISHDATAREYIVVDCPDGGMLKETVEATGKDYTKILNLKVTGKIDKRDFDFMKNEMSVLQSINLKEVEIVAYSSYKANEIPSSAFSGKSTFLRFVFPDKLTKIGGSAFSSTNLTGSLIIPEGVTEIGASAFSSCSSLSGTLTLPSSLEVIEGSAFSNCSNLIGPLVLPERLKVIGTYAFAFCYHFTGNLLLPENLEVLQSHAFAYCTGLSGSLKIPSKITKIEEDCFANCGFNGQLILPKGLTEVGSRAFSSCQFRGGLVLPEGLIIIGTAAFAKNDFSGTLVFPKSLSVLKGSAFDGCQRLTGVVELPEELMLVQALTFRDCTQLEGVILPKNIEAIGESAFENCFQLNSITCLAQNPPQLNASAFNGVAKDNFTVEVPEAAVANYSTAPNWKEFKRFAAHRDFSISRNLFRSLNAELSKTYVLRAPSGEAWSVASKPDWVTVSPANGVGKAEVTVTIAAQPKGAGCRTGEVVFQLDGKDYRTTMQVEQYDYQYGDGEVLTVQQATRGNGVNLVFMGDCFDAKDIYDGKYYDGITEAIGHFFDVEPYKTYKEYFNVYMVFGLSPDSGIGDVNTIREAKFGSAYSLGEIQPDTEICFEYACKAPINDNVSNTLITMVLNSSEYGGITYMWGDGSAIACCPMIEDEYPYDFRGVVQHEAGGHGFGKLGDEYIYHNAFIQTCACLCCNHVDEFNAAKRNGWYPNLSLSGSMSEVPWSHLIFDPQYSNVVDIYEGGYMHMRGVFRSEANSCMNNNIPYFSAISREAIVKRIKQFAGESYSFEDFKAKDVMTPSTGTRGWGDVIYAPSGKQHHPVYMGDKPKFRKR